MSIKGMKPRMGKNSHYKQGYFNVSSSSKYVGEQPCIYRSGLEYKFMQWCERNPSIDKWSSEPYFIKYEDLSSSNKSRKYYIDFTIKYKNGDKWLVEVKPYRQTIDVTKFQKVLSRLKTKDKILSYIKQSNETTVKNFSKWNEAQNFCKKNSSKFVIITENFFK